MGVGTGMKFFDGSLKERNESTEIRCRLARIREMQMLFVEDVKMEIFKLQRECPHINAKYQGDPAGGSDSYWYCWDCEASAVRRDLLPRKEKL